MLDGLTTALIPMGAWCELAHANPHPNIKEITGANEITEPKAVLARHNRQEKII
jgi:hypothetical protein